MTRPRLFPIIAALLIASASFTAIGVESARAWGWKGDEGEGASRQKPRAAPKNNKNGWNPALVAPAPPSSAEKADNAVKSEAPPGTAEAPANVKSYCENIADQALDARFLAQKAELTRLEEELAQRTALLEAKKAEYQEWLKRRDDFINKAEGSLVKLYSKIKPDSAAPQLAAMDEEAAAALLLKLSAKASSAILDQMDSAKAARLVSVMIGAAKPSDRSSGPEKSPAPNAPGGQSPESKKEAEQPQNAGKKS
jgi:flagellar motility protein MotE (MotC chaperone)